jgi:hypothetical protein
LKNNFIGSIEINFSVVHGTNKEIDFTNYSKIIPFKVQELFPTHRFPVLCVYTGFKSLEDFETCVRAHGQMYKIIKEDFELNIRLGLEEYSDL